MEPALSLSSMCARAVLGGVARCGNDPNLLVNEGCVDPLWLTDPDARVSLPAWHRLVRRAILLTHNRGLGLLIGGQVSEHALQSMGALALACPTLREAVRMLERYGALICNTMQFQLVEEGDLFHFACTPLMPVPGAPEFEVEMALGMAYRIARRFACLDHQDAREVWLHYPAPPHEADYAAVFRCPVRFDRPRNAILAARHYLDLRQPYADPGILQLLCAGAERMLASMQPPELPDQVRMLLRSRPDLRDVRATDIARTLRMTPRMLGRRLAEAGAPWSSLLDEARRRIACDALRCADSSLRELAERLGFSEQSAFNRAFKRWTGLTPKQYGRVGPHGSVPDQTEQTGLRANPRDA